ncbi:MAG: PilZ domain-containing protein [Myxococcota bacterium]
MTTSRHASTGRPVLVLDDGELDDVRALLHDLNVDFASAPLGAGAAAELRLVIATPRYLIGRESDRLAASAVSRRIAVWDGGSRTVRAQLERSDCDYVVERPVHPAALRLLIVHALYEGPEQRRRPRVAVGETVKLRSGLRSRPAVLLQLSSRGAGLAACKEPAVGEELKVVLPGALTGAGSQTLGARVISVDPRPCGADGTRFSVVFTGLSSASQSILSQIMRTRPKVNECDGRAPVARHEVRRRFEASGPAASPRDGIEPDAPAGESAEGPCSILQSGPGRSSPRKQYRRAVLATAEGGAMPLLGRDVSLGGMRVAPTQALSKGDELKLAIYGAPGVPPVVVKAMAMRDDGEAGWVLQFRALGPAQEEALATLIRSLPVLASPLRGDEGLSPVVVSEVVEESG